MNGFHWKLMELYSRKISRARNGRAWIMRQDDYKTLQVFQKMVDTIDGLIANLLSGRSDLQTDTLD